MLLPSRLLQDLVSPGWKSPKKVTPSLIESGIALAAQLSTPAFWKQLTPKEKKSLSERVAYFRQGKRPLVSELNQECWWLVQSRTLTMADTLGQGLGDKAAKQLVLKWLGDEKFLTLTESVPWADECWDRVLGQGERQIQTGLQKRTVWPAGYEDEAIYIDLNPEDLFTPYRILARWLPTLSLKKGDRVVDLGSGLGRVGMVLGLLYPEVHFTGIELMRERSVLAQKMADRFRLKNTRFVCGNLSKMGIPAADYYYFFNPFVGTTLRRVFGQLRKMSQHSPFYVAIAEIEAPWKQIKKQTWLKRVQRYRADKDWDVTGISLYRTSKPPSS